MLIYLWDKLVSLGINSRGDASILLILPWQAGQQVLGLSKIIIKKKKLPPNSPRAKVKLKKILNDS